MKPWFLPQSPDIVGLLVHQGEVTVGGMHAWAAWAHGTPGHEEEVRAAAHQAEALRRDLLKTLRLSFVTPVGPEDVFELSERLGTVLAAAKDLIRESEVLALAADNPIAQIAEHVVAGVVDVTGSFALLAREPDAATDKAESAIGHQREIEPVYRSAMSALLDEHDLRRVAGYRELYRRGARIGEAVERVAHRIWYAVVKEN